MEDIFIDNFEPYLTDRLTRLYFITIYHKPKDYSYEYMARISYLFEGQIAKTPYCMHGTLKEIEDKIPMDMVDMPRLPEEDPAIHSVYM